MSKYDDIASWYDASVRAGSLTHDLIMPHLLELIGDVRGLHICDLACGQGAVARKIAQCGAEVVGVDLSTELLKIAEREEQAEPLGVTYLQGNAEKLGQLPDETFDGVICNMSLMDISDLAGALHAVRRVLRASGWFVFSITHPCFESPHATWTSDSNGNTIRQISEYSAEGIWYSDNADGVRGKVGAHHRTLSTYLNALADCRLSLRRVVEPCATGRSAERAPGHAVVPPAMLVRCQKEPA